MIARAVMLASVGAEVLAEKQRGSVEGLVRLVERADERLEHVRHPDGDVEDHVDIRLPRARRQPYGVIEEQLVRADLEQDRGAWLTILPFSGGAKRPLGRLWSRDGVELAGERLGHAGQEAADTRRT